MIKLDEILSNNFQLASTHPWYELGEKESDFEVQSQNVKYFLQIKLPNNRYAIGESRNIHKSYNAFTNSVQLCG